mmetsp:Transcript_111582/g.197708  ORF Transcript_111582/g.197708 Transcript_111582/m.197708 type:complete len:472 (-) Transcript_111582:41-1456(-)
MAARGTAAAPIATPSRDYGQKIAHRDYQGEKEFREELRRLEAEERRIQRETGSSVDVGGGGTQWRDISEGSDSAPNQKSRRKSGGRNKSIGKKDALDLWWAEEKGEESLPIGAPPKPKKKKPRPKKQSQKSPSSGGDATPGKAYQGKWDETSQGDQSWKSWGSWEAQDAQGWKEAQDAQGWKSWDGKYAETGTAKTSKPAAGKAKPAAGKAKSKAAPKKSKPEKVNVWDAWNVSENQPDDERESREIILSGYLGPDLASPASATEEPSADSSAPCEDQTADSSAPCEDQGTEQPAPNFEEASLHMRLVQFLQHRDKGDDASRSEAREFLRKVAQQEKEVGTLGKLSPDDVELAIGSWERRLWCMAWLREKGKDELGKAAGILRHAANKGMEFAGLGALQADEVEDAVDEYEREVLPEQFASESDSEENEDDDAGAEGAQGEVTPAAEAASKTAEGTSPTSFKPPERLSRFQ